ncbi:hypothetical protein SLEP1_g22811 [Rubroshorea leprosula]|uniref:Uncharacterized protein n=1 Tax=Rubroshorea leprosula TaxID=152421 RepID=A0AAV5JGE9_9ROSI|nr:hypothetical protein SLEP1_g22811 [Rubroshorea leprosula]
MICALDDFLEIDTLEKLGSLPSQTNGGVLSLNVGEQVIVEDGEVDFHDRWPSMKETIVLSSPAMASSNSTKLKPTFSYITKPLEPISSQALQNRMKSLPARMLKKEINLLLSYERRSSNQIVHHSLSKEINELTEKKGSLKTKIESLKNELDSEKLIKLENSKVVAIETVAEVERMRQDLETEFEAITNGAWVENNM